MTTTTKVIIGVSVLAAIGGIYFVLSKKNKNKTDSLPQNASQNTQLDTSWRNPVNNITNPTTSDIKLVAGGRGH